MADSNKSRARLIAAALAGAWRESTAPPELSEEQLESIAPSLLQSGAAGLVWWRTRHSHLKDSYPAGLLKQAYQFQAIEAALRDREIATVFGHLRGAGVEPILVKGWAVARHYPEKGLRPQGDIDLIVRPEELESAKSALKHPDCDGYNVDLGHREFARLGSRDLEILFERSRLADLNGTSVRVLGPEDHLVFLSMHALRHSAWRPLWLCDIAVVIESRPPDFDWKICVRSRRISEMIGCAAGLSHRLLGARLDDTPFGGKADRLPQWLVREVLKQWENSDPMAHPPFNYRAPMSTYLHRPSGLLSDLAARWPGPIEATVSLRGPFNSFPRLPFQLGDSALRTVRFLAGLVRSGERAAEDC